MDPTKLTSESDSTTGFAALTGKDSFLGSVEKPPQQLGKFKIGPEIGRGGMGIVYQATDVELGREVALKVLPSNARVSDVHHKRFQVEARVAAQLNHDNIVPIFHIGEDSGTHYFAMKYIVGADLSHVIREARHAVRSVRQSGQPPSEATVPNFKDSKETEIDFSAASFSASLSPSGFRSTQKLAKSVALLGRQVAEALHHAHENGIVHRDIKPSNLMLDARKKVWVTDFGLAQLQNSPALTQSGDVVGTLRYMSPEQASGQRAFIDHRTDIYSLGVALYELATLERACRGNTAREILREVTFERPTPVRKINPRLPRDFETIICKATERNPTDRYQTAAEMAEDLRRFVADENLRTKRVSKLKRVRDWFYERPLVASALAASLFILLASLSVVAFTLRSNLNLAKEKVAEKEALLTESEGLHLQTLAMIARDENPGLAMALAMAGNEAAPGFAANQASLFALAGNHEKKTIPLDTLAPGQLALSQDGKRFVVCSNRRLFEQTTPAAIFDLQSGDRIVTIDAISPVTTAVYGPAGEWLLTGGASIIPKERGKPLTLEEIEYAPVGVVDAQNGRLLRSIPDARVIAFSGHEFSPDGTHVLLPTTNNAVEVYETKSWKKEFIVAHPDAVLQALYSPNGSNFVTWCANGNAYLRASTDGSELLQIPYPAKNPLSVAVAFSPDARLIMITGDSGTRLHSAEDGSLLLSRPEQVSVFGHTDNRVYLRSLDRTKIYIFSPQLARVVAECQADGTIENFSLSTADHFVAVSCDRNITLFDARDGKRLADCRGHSDTIVDMLQLPTSGGLLSVSWDRTARVWDARSDAEKRTFPTYLEPTGSPIIDYTPDGSQALLASVSGFRTSILPSIASATEDAIVIDGNLLGVFPDGRLITSEGEVTTVWDPSNSRRLASLDLPRRQIIAGLAVPARQGSQAEVLITSREGKAFRWKTETNQVDPLTGFGETASQICLIPDSPNVLIGMLDGRLYQVSSDNTRVLLKAFEAGITSIAVDAQGLQAAIATTDNQVAIWNLNENRLVTTFREEGLPISDARFALGDKFIVTHAFASTTKIALWSIEDDKLEASTEFSRTRDIALNEDGTQLLATSYKEGALLWDLSDNQQTVITDIPCAGATFRDGRVVIATERHRFPPAMLTDGQARPMQNAQLLAWDLDEARIVEETQLDLNATNLRTLQDGRLVFSSHAFGAEVVDIETGIVRTRILNDAEVLALAAFAPNEKSIVTASSGGKIRIQDAYSGNLKFLGSHDFQLTAAAISPDRKQLLTSDTANVTRLWDLTDNSVRDLPPTDGPISRHAFGPSGSLAASIVEPSSVKTWDLRSADGSTYRFEQEIRHLEISPDETSLLVITGPPQTLSATQAYDHLHAQFQGSAFLLDLETKEINAIDNLDSAMCGIFLDARQVAILDVPNVIRIVDTKSLEQSANWKTHPRCLALMPSPPGSQRVFGTSLNRLSAWNTSGELTLDLPLQLSAGDADGDLRDWRIQPPNSPWLVVYNNRSAIRLPSNPSEYLAEIAPRSLSPQERALYLGRKAVIED